MTSVCVQDGSETQPSALVLELGSWWGCWGVDPPMNRCWCQRLVIVRQGPPQVKFSTWAMQRARVWLQLVKDFPRRHNEPASIFRIHVKNTGLALGVRDKRTPGVRWPASLASLGELQAQERPHPKGKMEDIWGMDAQCWHTRAEGENPGGEDRSWVWNLSMTLHRRSNIFVSL